MKKGSSPQRIWSFNAGFFNSSVSLNYYSIKFDSFSVNLTINSVSASDFNVLYTCVDTSVKAIIVSVELVESLNSGKV